MIEVALDIDVEIGVTVLVDEEAAVEDVLFVQGEAKTVRFTIQETVNQQSTPVDITGATLTWVIEQEPGTPLLTKPTGDFTIPVGTDGVATVDLDAVETAQEPGVYGSELKVELTGGTIDKRGRFPVEFVRSKT